MVSERNTEGVTLEKETPVTETAMPVVGDTAPAIDADITGGGRFVLGEHKGKWVVVYFYVRANTPG